MTFSSCIIILGNLPVSVYISSDSLSVLQAVKHRNFENISNPGHYSKDSWVKFGNTNSSLLDTLHLETKGNEKASKLAKQALG